MEKFNNECDYLIHLLSAALDRKKPLELPENLSFDNVFAIAKEHSVANMAYYSIERLEEKPSPELLRQWAEVRDKAIIKDIVQQTESEKLKSRFAAENIRHMPLKGAILKKLYPQSDFRSMGDFDMLVDVDSKTIPREIMKSEGYTLTKHDHPDCDEYTKKPVMYTEIHYALFGSCHEYAPLFADVWSLTEKTGDFCVDFTPFYFLAYIISHAMKHYGNGGTGIRSFMDIEVYRRSHDIDMEEIYVFFGKIGKREACEDMVKLSEIWFRNGEYTDKYRKMAEYIILGGTYGSIANHVAANAKKQGKFRYIIRNIFPSVSTLANQFPVLLKAPLLYPFCWLIRAVRAVTVNLKYNIEKVKALKK